MNEIQHIIIISKRLNFEYNLFVGDLFLDLKNKLILEALV